MTMSVYRRRDQKIPMDGLHHPDFAPVEAARHAWAEQRFHAPRRESSVDLALQLPTPRLAPRLFCHYPSTYWRHAAGSQLDRSWKCLKFYTEQVLGELK